ncbi:MAG: hypothetical protein PVI23_16175 [Maricaulaceae bacterium]|jgi:hypothetical protein
MMKIPDPIKLDTARFLAGEIRSEDFRHDAHVAIAAALLVDKPFLEAAQAYANVISHMATAAGRPEAFNLTITLAFLSVIAERLHDAPEDDLDAFLAANPDLLDKRYLKHWYADDRLRSPTARTIFLLPEPSLAS